MAWHLQFYKGNPADIGKSDREHLRVGEMIRLNYDAWKSVPDCPHELILLGIDYFQQREKVQSWKEVADYYEAIDCLEHTREGFQ